MIRIMFSAIYNAFVSDLLFVPPLSEGITKNGMFEHNWTDNREYNVAIFPAIGFTPLSSTF